MHQYELMVILDPEIDERTVAPSLDKFLNVIRNDGGTIDKVDIWGTPSPGLRDQQEDRGHLRRRQLHRELVTPPIELDRQLKLSEAVMRTKVLRAEEAIAQVAEAAKLADEKAARKAAAPRPRQLLQPPQQQLRRPRLRPKPQLRLPQRRRRPRSSHGRRDRHHRGGQPHRDPELRYTQNGLAVANFTIASTPRTFDRASERLEGRRGAVPARERAGASSPSTSPDR